ncbi:MAG: M14-type cytosolic carboxypeptidase [Rubripirellula sp.]
MSHAITLGRKCARSFARKILTAVWIGFAGISVAHADPSALSLVSTSFDSVDKNVRFEVDFPGGKIDRLIENSSDNFEIVIRPETDNSNDSAWYAFRVHSKSSLEIKIRIRYEGGSHRYAPKISHDRVEWTPADHLIVSRHPGGREVTLKLPVTDKPLWVASQELVSNKDIASWINEFDSKPFISNKEIGQSVNGRPIHSMTIGDPNAADSIFILSRQHPPEVTGTIGMMHFVETLCADTPLANQFRRLFQTSVVPIANPDGVAKGYWRANANGVDLNRDWLHFTQPETRAIHDELVSLRDRKDGRMWLFLDFHSTFNEVFYTAPIQNDLFPAGFTKDWLAAIDDRMPSFDVLREEGHNAHRATSKAWVARELGIHAITYEFGDETDRDRIRDIATQSAEEMMKLLIARKTAESK